MLKRSKINFLATDNNWPFFELNIREDKNNGNKVDDFHNKNTS